MKIQSLLVLAATVGSATAANKRKRVFKIYSREEIQAAERGTRSLQGGDDLETDAEPVAMSMSMELSPTMAPTAMSMMTNCAFCHGLVIPDPDFELPNDQTCGSIKAIADDMKATNQWCEMIQRAEEYCCPVIETTTVATVATATTTEATIPVTTTVPAAPEVTVDPPAPETFSEPSG